MRLRLVFVFLVLPGFFIPQIYAQTSTPGFAELLTTIQGCYGSTGTRVLSDQRDQKTKVTLEWSNTQITLTTEKSGEVGKFTTTRTITTNGKYCMSKCELNGNRWPTQDTGEVCSANALAIQKALADCGCTTKKKG